MKSKEKAGRRRMKRILLFIFFFICIVMAVWAINRVDPDFERYAQLEKFKGRTLKYYSSPNNDSLPVLLMLHGAPGRAGNFKSYLLDSGLRQQFQIVIPDRLGYGGSDPGNYTGIEKQSAFYNHWLDTHFSGREVFVFGHSFGATIACYMGINPSETITKMMLLAPAIDPENEKYFPLGRLSIYPWSRWLFSKNVRVSGQEKYGHAKELEAIENEWPEFKVQCLYIHGNKDKIVPYVNMAYAKKHLPASYLNTLTLDQKGHLTVFTEREQTIGMIQSYFLRNEIPVYH